jgi:CRISPR-associated protein Cas2
MVIMILERVPPSLRGELSRWLFEIKTGVYVGHVSALVREKIWEHCSANKKAGGVIQIWTTNNEQHFSIRMVGTPGREVKESEGMQMVWEFPSKMTEVQKKRSEENR